MQLLAERFVIFFGWWSGFSERESQDLSNFINCASWLANSFSVFTSVVYGLTINQQVRMHVWLISSATVFSNQGLYAVFHGCWTHKMAQKTCHFDAFERFISTRYYCFSILFWKRHVSWGLRFFFLGPHWWPGSLLWQRLKKKFEHKGFFPELGVEQMFETARKCVGSARLSGWGINDDGFFIFSFFHSLYYFLSGPHVVQPFQVVFTRILAVKLENDVTWP